MSGCVGCGGMAGGVLNTSRQLGAALAVAAVAAVANLRLQPRLP